MNLFKSWGKTPRLFNSNVTVTEKIDGTNAAIQIYNWDTFEELAGPAFAGTIPLMTTGGVVLLVQSRTRFLSLEEDNHDFYQWVIDNRFTLVEDLGEGTHFGEWWGYKINRNYGLDHRRFSLFNTAKWKDVEFKTPHLSTVPIIGEHERFNENAIKNDLRFLEQRGSFAAPGFKKPEGVCVFHHASNKVFKYTFNDTHKGA